MRVRHNTGWHVTTRVAWLASVGDRAICLRPLLRAIPSVSRAWVVGLKLAPSPARVHSARVPKKVARRRTRLRSWGAGRAVTSPKCRPGDLPRPRSSYLSQMARQISLVPMGAAHRTPIAFGRSRRRPLKCAIHHHRTPITCHLHLFESIGHPVRVRLSATECGVAGGGDGCHVGRPATIWDLRAAGCESLVVV